MPARTATSTPRRPAAWSRRWPQRWPQRVVVENRGGGAGAPALEAGARATPDGYTLLVGAVHHTIATSVYKKLPYDFQKDFAPITTIALVPNVLVVNPSLPAKDVKELVALIRANPGKVVPVHSCKEWHGTPRAKRVATPLAKRGAS